MEGIPPVGPSPEARQKIETVANELEGVFLRLLLTQARTSSVADQDGPFASSGAMDQFQEMLHGQLADRAAGGLGLADLIARDLIAHQSRRASP